MHDAASRCMRCRLPWHNKIPYISYRDTYSGETKERKRGREKERGATRVTRRVPPRRGWKEVAQAPPRSSSRSPARSLQGENAPWHGWIGGRSSRRSKSGDAGQEWGVRQNRKLHIRARPMVRE